MDISVDTALAIAAGVIAFLFVFNVATALSGAAFGVAIERIQFGYSPTVRLFRIGRTEVRAGPILLGGHVEYVPPEDGGFYAPWPVRALNALAGPIVTLAMCAIPLGGRVVDEALMAWPQMWAVVADWSTPVDLNEALRPSFESGGFVAAVAVVAVKAAMFNLVPLVPLGGAAFLATLVEAVTGREFIARLPQPVLWTSVILVFGFMAVFVWRVVTGA